MVVSDGRGGEELAPARGVQHVHFVGRAGERAGLAGAPEAPDGVEGRSFPACGPCIVFWAFRVSEVYGDELDAERLDVGEAGDGTGGVVVVLRGRVTGVFPTDTDAFVECGQGLASAGGGHVEEAAPDFGAGEATRGKARDDAEVVGAAFEGAPEVGVGGFGGCSDRARREDDLVADDVGADEAKAGGEEGEATCVFALISSRVRG